MPQVGAVIETETRAEPGAMTAIARWMTSWGQNATKWAQSATEHLGDPEPDDCLDDLADVVRCAREPAEVELALARLACQMAAALRAELVLEPAKKAVSTVPRRLIACWPETDSRDAAESGLQTPLTLAVGPVALSRTTLRLTPAPGQRWTPRLIRQLTTLCTLAAAARTALLVARPATSLASPPYRKTQEQTGALRDGRFLKTFLSYALPQAKRNESSLSLICVALDRFAAIHSLLGAELAEAAIHRMATTIIGTLRAGDVVAQLDDGRLIVALTNDTQALAVAETVRRAIDCMGSATTSLPVLTASIGVVSYPKDATDVAGLITAATQAATRNRGLRLDGAESAGDKPLHNPPSRSLSAYRREP